MTDEYEAIIGLEIHSQLKTKTKLFCNSKNDPDEIHPNINICPVCVGHPGTLPTINFEAVKKIILVGLTLDCEISDYTFFERKNYFYPDLPKGYQISQYQAPICKNGHLKIKDRLIRIERIHLEEDTGKLIHSPDGKYSFVDFNRAGIPLMELVTKPDLRSGDEVRRFGEELQLILRYLGASDADMQKGQMRIEVNISMRKKGSEVLGTKVELKNINSFKFANQAVDYEIKRQTKLLRSGKKVIQETRGWDEINQRTFSQRIKEEAHDYRYFPEPDLPPIRIRVKGDKSPESENEIYLDDIKAILPELPWQRRERFKKQYNLPDYDIEVLTFNKKLGDYFEKVVSELKEWDKLSHLKPVAEDHKNRLIKLSANYLITELQKILNERGLDSEEIEHIKITPENFAEFIVRIHHQEISSSSAQVLLKEMFETGEDPEVIIEKLNLAQVSDIKELTVAVKEVITENQKAVEDYKNGKKEVIQFLIGQVMKKTKGRANPNIIKEILEKELAEFIL